MKVEPQIRTVTRRKGRSAQISRSHNHQQFIQKEKKQDPIFFADKGKFSMLKGLYLWTMDATVHRFTNVAYLQQLDICHAGQPVVSFNI